MKLYVPAPQAVVLWARVILCITLLYKLFSRDFSIFGLANQHNWFFNHYPQAQYSISSGINFLGIKPIVDIFSFHWIHWVLPFPSELVLSFIQRTVITLLIIILFVGGGKKKGLYILAYILISYLFGFIWRTNGEIDAVFMQFQVLLLFCFYQEKEPLTLFDRNIKLLQYSRKSGWFFSMIILIFGCNYFLAGMNKLIDLSILDWFRFDLYNVSLMINKQAILGGDHYIINVISFLREHPSFELINVTVAFTYLMELGAIAMFFNRRLIPFLMIYFISFHIITSLVNILFMGNILMWLIFIPVYRSFQNVVLVWDGNCTFCKKYFR